MTQVRQAEMTVTGVRTRALRVDGAGPHFVLLHGYSDSAETWSGVLDEVVASGGSAVAVDLPGYGKADRVADESDLLLVWDDFIDALVRQESVRGPVVLVGNSLGGALAVRAGTRDLPLLGVVTVCDPAAGRWRTRDRMHTLPVRALQVLCRVPLVPRQLFRLLVTALLRRGMYAHRAAADPVVVARLVDYFVDGGGLPWLVSDATRVITALGGMHGPLPVACGLMIIHGGADRIVPSAGSRELHARMPGSRLLVRADWGHCPQLDDPAGLLDAISQAAREWQADQASTADPA